MTRRIDSPRTPSTHTDPKRRALPQVRGGWPRRLKAWSGLAILLLSAAGHHASAQTPPPAGLLPYPAEGCVATIDNRSSLVDQNGTFAVPNVPQDPGSYRVNIVCPQPDGSLLGSQSAPQNLSTAPSFFLPLQPIHPLAPQPNSITLGVLSGALSSIGAQVQLSVLLALPDGTPRDGTLASSGTTYSSSNTAVATVDPNGIVTATGPGSIVITARNDGLVATIVLASFGLLDSDGDGMPDIWEIANGLNPYDPTDAALDPDGDGLTNLQEFQHGTNPHVADTDGDGLNDGLEVQLGTNPLNPDTDGDGLNDGDEVRLGTDPLNPDTDGDGIPDGVEVKLGLNPLVPDVTTTLTGHVSNPDGTPFVNAAVVVLTYFNGLSDGTGTFTLLHVPTTLGNLVATAQATSGTTVLSGSSTATTPVGAGVTNVGTIVLGQASGQVSGSVTNADNKAIAGAQVTVTDGNDTRTTTTDPTGLYVFSGLQAGAVAVTVFDPATSLRGMSSGNLLSTTPLVLNVKLGGFGTVSGTVSNAAGATLGAGIAVTISGTINSTVTTDALGHYSFSFVPLGTFIIDATDTAGDHGRTTGIITATAQTIQANVQFLGKGTVSGTVTDASGAAVAGAAVELDDSGIFGLRLYSTTNAMGQYTFSNVWEGPVVVSATSTATGTSGYSAGNVTTDKQTVTLNITLQPSGTLTGTVTRSDGTTVVPNAVVSVFQTGLSAVANSSGVYTIPSVPLGTYSLRANDTSTGDQGAINVTLSTAGQTVTQNVKMQGLGTLTVTVKDGAGNVVPNAFVTAGTQGVFYVQQTGVTNASGVLTLTQVLAGGISLSATDPATGLAGTANTTVTSGGTATATVVLQSYGQIQGTLYRADAATPIAGATVMLDGATATSTTTDASGHYAFAVATVGTHNVAAFDSNGNQLAYAATVTVATQGQVVTANLVAIGLGTVTGHVTNPDGTPASGIGVTVANTSNANDLHPYLVSTDVNGLYTVAGVPAGAFSAVAQAHTATTTSYGSTTGTVPPQGGTVTADITLSTALIPTTTTLTDANGEAYTVHQNGALVNGQFSVFAGDFAANAGGELLSFVTPNGTVPFAGSEFATATLNGRQLSIEQDGVAGLNVTRRVYVPSDGYFARYLELITNPTASDITVGVQFTTYYRDYDRLTQIYGNNQYQSLDVEPARVLLTSSGDNILNIADPSTPDRWVTIAGPIDYDPFLPSGVGQSRLDPNIALPPVAEVFDGPGAALAPNTAGFLSLNTGSGSVLNLGYGSLTVKAGATVGLLHFVAEQNSFAGANASASRLAQLPPEALTGMTAADMNAVQNFVLPAGGTSTVAALPGFSTGVSGQVLASDSTTPVPAATVSLQSTDPLFGRLYFAQSNSSGNYNYPNPAILLEPYNVSATHPITGVVSPVMQGTFQSGTTVSTQNITFSNTGTIVGTVSRGPNVVTAAGTVTLTGGSLNTVSIPLNGDGTFSFTGVPQGTYALVAAVTNTLLTGTATAVVTTGNTVTANIDIGGAGNIQGTVTRPDGSLAINDTVNLRIPGATPLMAPVDTSGHYTFVDIPIGSYTLDAFDNSSNSSATATVAVTDGATTTENLVLQSTGTVNGTVTANDGTSTANLTVTLTSTTTSGTQTLTATTASNGTFTFNAVKPGTLSLHVVNAAGLQGNASANLPLAGQSVTVNIALLATGTLTGTVYQGDGTTPAPGIQVTLSPAPLTGSATTITDANGAYNFTNVNFGSFTVTALNTTTGDSGSATGQIQVNGQLRTINITLLGRGNLLVKVVNQAGSAVSNAAVKVIQQSGNLTVATGNTDATGSITFANLPVSNNYVVYATDPATGFSTSAAVSVTYNTTQTLTLTVHPVGSVQGVVYGVDGVTPVAGATVALAGSLTNTTTTASDGSYSFPNLELPANIAFSVRDSNGYLRATAPVQYLYQAGQSATVNFTFIGLGTISGTVTNADGTRATNLGLTIVNKNASIGNTQTVTTGGDGTYTVSDEPVGAFTVTASTGAGFAGYGYGSITKDGDAEVVNIQIQSSTVTLPLTLNDADGYAYTISSNGDYANNGQIYSTTAYYDAPTPFYDTQALQLSVSGSSNTFGSGAPTTAIQTLSGRQIEISEQNDLGLNVTRKVYVPTDGYFGRRIDELTNPTSSPITVTVAYKSAQHFTPGYAVVVNTSNNNATVDKTILWEVDSDKTTTQTALANVFAGPQAPTGVAGVTDSFTELPYRYGNFYYGYENLSYTYQPITVAPNSTVSFLFFTAQEGVLPTGTTAAQRLVQLPAEALAGLSSTELASVVNFVIPSSPLPAVTTPAGGAIVGHVYAYDGTTIIPNAHVFEQSTDLEYGFSTTIDADANAAYNIPSVVGPNFSVYATDPINNIQSPSFTGTIPSSAGFATQDISFTNTGIVQGQVKANGTSTFTGGSIYVQYQCQNQPYSCSGGVTFGPDGNFVFLALPPGNNSFSATVITAQGASYNIPASGYFQQQVNAGQTTQLNFTLPATGNIMGTVTNADGTAATGIKVYAIPSGTGAYSVTTTGSNGAYAFTSLPLDTYTVQATDTSTNDTVHQSTTLTKDATNTVNLQFLGKGTLVVTVKYFNGNLGQGSYINLATATNPSAGSTSVDSNGQATFTNVPVGTFTVVAYYPNGQNIFSTSTGSFNTSGGTQQFTATLPPVGTISGTLTNSDGTPAAGQYITIADNKGQFSASPQTDSAGTYAFFPVPADRTVNLTAQSYNATINKYVTASATNQQVPGDGQTLTVNLRYPGLANVHVAVLNADGTPVTNFPGAYLTSTDGKFNYSQGTAADGTTTFTNVVEDSYLATANAGSDFSLGSTLFSFGAAQDGTTVNVTITATPKATLQGQVYASDGTTVIRDNYYVQVTDPLTKNYEYTNPSGGAGYQINDVQVGAQGYSIMAQVNNVPGSAVTYTGTVKTDGQVITQNFTLPTSSISGTVFLNDGITPVPNISIYAYGACGMGCTATFYTSTDTNGTYQLSGPTTGQVTVTSSDSNGVTGSTTVTLASDTQIVTGANISLEATGYVSGTVYDATGIPVPNAQVYLQSSANNNGFYASTTADSNGSFNFSDVAAGNITLSTDSTNPQETATGTLVNNGDTLTLNLGTPAAAQPASIFGTVYDSNQNPATSAIVTAVDQPASGGSTVTQTATTDDQGMYSISGLPVGTANVSAVLTDGSSSETETATIASAGTPVEVDLGLSNPGDVSGFIYDASGNPAGGVIVVLSDSNVPDTGYYETNNSDGSYDFGGITPGDITVQAQDANGNVLGQGTGTLPYGGNLVINVTYGQTGGTGTIVIAPRHAENLPAFYAHPWFMADTAPSSAAPPDPRSTRTSLNWHPPLAAPASGGSMLRAGGAQ